MSKYSPRNSKNKNSFTKGLHKQTSPMIIPIDNPSSLGGSKRCSKCGFTKPLFDFHIARRSADGHHNQCKTCRAEYSNSEQRRQVEKHRRLFSAAGLEPPRGSIIGTAGIRSKHYSADESCLKTLRDAEGDSTWEAMAVNYGVSVATMMNWQKNGCPKRVQGNARFMRNALRAHYEALVVAAGQDSGTGRAKSDHFLNLCLKDGWEISEALPPGINT